MTLEGRGPRSSVLDLTGLAAGHPDGGKLFLPNLNADIINNGVVKGNVRYIFQTGALMPAVGRQRQETAPNGVEERRVLTGGR